MFENINGFNISLIYKCSLISATDVFAKLDTSEYSMLLANLSNGEYVDKQILKRQMQSNYVIGKYKSNFMKYIIKSTCSLLFHRVTKCGSFIKEV